MSLTVSNVFKQTQAAKMVTNPIANQKEILPLVIGGIILFGLAVGTSSCKKQQNEEKHDMEESLNDMYALLHSLENQLNTPGLSEDKINALKEQIYPLRLKLIDLEISSGGKQGENGDWVVFGHSSDFRNYRESFSADTGKLREFAEWHVENFPNEALKPQDYTPKRAAYFVITNEQAKDWYDTHFLKLVG